MYADETTVLEKSDSLITVLDNTMAPAKDHTMNWFKIKKLHCNPNKTEFKTKSKSKYRAPIYKRISFYKSNSKLNWKFRIDNTTK